MDNLLCSSDPNLQAERDLRMHFYVCHASLIPRYDWLPAFDDSRRTPNKKEFTNASLTVPPEQQMARAREGSGHTFTRPGSCENPHIHFRTIRMPYTYGASPYHTYMYGVPWKLSPGGPVRVMVDLDGDVA